MEASGDAAQVRVELNESKKAGKRIDQPARNQNPGEDLASLAKNRSWQWWHSVNPDSAEKERKRQVQARQKLGLAPSAVQDSWKSSTAHASPIFHLRALAELVNLNIETPPPAPVLGDPNFRLTRATLKTIRQRRCVGNSRKENYQ